jgi:hypothetical protein
LGTVTAVFAGGEASGALDQSGRLHVWGKVPKYMSDYTGRAVQLAMGSSTWLVIEQGTLAP